MLGFTGFSSFGCVMMFSVGFTGIFPVTGGFGWTISSVGDLGRATA